MEWSDKEFLFETESARFYRLSKSGKYFLLKGPKSDAGLHKSLIEREFNIARNLDHPNIAKALFLEDKGMILEYVDGVNLREFLAGNPSAELRRRVLSQLLDAVGYIHRKGVVHNDLKPENILISSKDNSVRLIDFGLSDDDAYYLAKTMGCSPAYASPELLGRQGNVDARSDIFSLGRIIKEIFPKKYKSIAAKCLSINPSRRYPNTDSIKAAIQRSDRLPYLLAGGIGLLLAAVLILIAFHRSNAKSKELEQATQRIEATQKTEEAAKREREALISKLEAKLDAQIVDAYNSSLKEALDSITTNITPQEAGFNYAKLFAERMQIAYKTLEGYRAQYPEDIMSIVSEHYVQTYNSYTEKYLDALKEINPELN